MKRLFGSILLATFLLAPGAFAKGNSKGPKINYKKRYIAQPYNRKQKQPTMSFGMPKGKRAPKS
jgi:hypothetical protein